MRNSIFILFLGITTLMFSQQKDPKDLEREARKDVREGNELYNQLKFEEAEIAYKKALDKNPNYAKASYNLANTIYQQNKNKNSCQDCHMFGLPDKCVSNIAVYQGVKKW